MTNSKGRKGIDTALLRRASMLIPRMSPGQLPVLLDALQERAVSVRVDGSWMALVEEQVEAAAAGFPPGPQLLRYMEETGLTLPELIGHMRSSYLADGVLFEDWVQRTVPVWNYMQLTKAATQDRFAYFCTEEVSALVAAGAAPELLTMSATPDELPSPTGIAYLWQPGHVRILLWAVTDSGSIEASLTESADMQLWLAPKPKKAWGPDRMPCLAFTRAQMSEPGTDNPPRLDDGVYRSTSIADPRDPATALTYLLSLAHMIQQERLIDATDQVHRVPGPPNQHGHRRNRRETVTYLSYYRRSQAASAVPLSRSYNHRWIVRGHWRRQWYPTLQRHKPIWITDHIAGPEDAPLVVRDKVRLPRPTADSG
ncbi:hypothetical protein LIX17_25725 (plasmid) [Mycobacterium avium subsp. hominissuis]|uniref:hypothetical protein n=1 Tax=Mycobacterium avium TaxID=1764 RepID=UPI0031405CA8